MTLRNIDTLFSSRKVALLGDPQTPAQLQLVENMRNSAASGHQQVTSRPGSRRLPAADADIAVVLDGRWGKPKLVSAMGESGYRAILWAARENVGDDVLRAARPYNLRILGGRSAGLIDTRSGLNLSTMALAPPAGQVALVTQSQSLTAAALDWALGRNIGFSWAACTGAEADIDIADLLDHAALDPRTRAVVLQVGMIRHPRKFMSAARAAARVKPVLVLQTRHARHSGAAGPDPVRSAAFERAGLVECENLGGLFDGLAALELLPRVRDNRVLVLGNGAGVCALATDALRRQSLEPARASDATIAAIAQAAPLSHDIGVAIDLALSSPEQTLAAIRVALTDDCADAVLLAHSPVAGHPHAPLVATLAAAGLDARVLTVWLGLYSAQEARQASAHARLATFASVDEAARAVRYRGQYRMTRALLTATPPPDPSVTADVEALRRRLAALAADQVEWLSVEDTRTVLGAYGMAGANPAESPPDNAFTIRVRVARHPELGMVLSVSDESLGVAPAYGFAPLDALLARRMLDNATAGRLNATVAAFEALAMALVRMSKLTIDLWHVTRVDVHLAVGPLGRMYAPVDGLLEITRQPLPDRQRLAMSPYPARMRHRVVLRGERGYIVRAIRPSDEPLVLGLLDSLSPEEIRLRFFNHIRHFSHDMAARITQVDYDREVSLVISAADNPQELAGMGTIIADPDGIAAEFAILVHRNHTGVGLGRHLLDCLLRQAGARGIRTVYGEVLSHNRAMLTLARSMGFVLKRSLDDAGSVRTEIDVAAYRTASRASSAGQLDEPQ